MKEQFKRNKKIVIILVTLLFFGLVLRAIMGNNLSPSPDETVYGTHAIDFSKSGAISNQNQSPVWFYLADIFYKIFGVTLFASRLTSIIFSTFTILVIFLLAKELFNKKIALISSFLFAFSAYSLRIIQMEMDATFTFFYLLSVYFFLSKLFKEDKISLLSALFYGIAVLTKAISIMLAPGFFLVYLVYFLRYNEKRKNLVSKENIKRALFSLLIVFILLLPILSYNYLLYKEKGLTDIMFARFFGISIEIFEGIAPTMQPFSLTSLVQDGLRASFLFFYRHDLLLLSLSFLGFIYYLLKKNLKVILLVLTFLPTYFFLSGTSLLDNHFLVFVPLLSLLAAFPLHYLFQIKFHIRYLFILILFVIAFFNVYSLRDILGSTSAVGTLRDFVIDNVDESTLVIADNRIYGGRIAWMFNDKHYVEVLNLDPILNELKKSPTSSVSIKTLFIECAADDCGFGTIKEGPLNDSMESFSTHFKEKARKIREFGPGGGDKPEGVYPYFEVYESRILAKPEILNIVDQTHIWFYYPVRWNLKERIYDSYTPISFFDKSFDFIATLVLYLSVFIALISPLILVYLTYKNINDSP